MGTKKQSKSTEAAKGNREQRRREKFGGAGPVGREQPNQWPESQPNPALGTGGGSGDAVAGRPDQDQTDLTGPGTGGATQSAGRQPNIEGQHPGTKPKG